MTVIPDSNDYNKAYNVLALRAHNRCRNGHQVGDVVFDAALAKGAQLWAAQLAKDGKLSYSTPVADKGAPPNSGENVVKGEQEQALLTTDAAFDKWCKEGDSYDFAAA